MTAHGPSEAWARRVRLVLLGMGSDLLIALIKFAAACVTSSAAMFAEGIHSVMDLSMEGILLYGAYAARRPADVNHQLGFGREAFFWNFIAALVLLALGSGVTLHEAFAQIVSPRPIEDGWVNYAVLGIAILLEGGITWYALKTGNFTRLRLGVRRYIADSRDATSLTVLATSIAGVVGLLIALVGTVAGSALGQPVMDGISSATIAMLMGATALVLAAQSKSLLIGAAASDETVADIEHIAAELPEVAAVNGSLTVHLAAEQLLVGLSVAFAPGHSTEEIEAAVATLERAVKVRRPDVRFLFVRPETVRSFEERKRFRGW